MRVALFGGSFDPPHSGHLRVATEALQLLALDQVLFAPTGRQPLKQGNPPPAPFADRLAMLELLIAGHPGLQTSTIDAPHPDGAPNYTADTVRRLRPTLPSGAELLFLAGADSFHSLAHWREAPALLRPRARGGLLDGWIVATRPQTPSPPTRKDGPSTLPSLQRTLPPPFQLTLEDTARPSCLLAGCREDAAAPALPVYLLPTLDDPSSATAIRTDLAHADGAALPPAVFAYIQAHGLYQG